MNNQRKMSSTERQNLILELLQEESSPITGSAFSKKTNVSRQVIVQDISILKAKNEPIIATSRGYLYITEQVNENKHRLIIAVDHTPEQTAEELYILVDHGVTVRDVIVEHAIYGEITASLMIQTRAEVDQFINKIKTTNATYLSRLTDGIHLHTVEADTTEKIEAAVKKLKEAHILLQTQE